MKKVWVLLLLPSIAWGNPKITCPKDSSKVDFTPPYGGNRIIFCQTSHKGKIVRHGAEWTLSKLTGEVISKRYYHLGIPTDKPIKTSKKRDLIKEKLERVYDRFLLLWNINLADKEVHIFSNRPDLCQMNSRKRMAFLLKGKPYKEYYEFRARCFRQGTMNYAFNKSFQSTFELRDFFEYDKLIMKYEYSKKQVKGDIFFSTKITDAKLKGSKSEIKLSALIKTRFNVREVIGSKGRNGMYTESFKVNVTEVDGKPYKMEHDIFAQ